VTSEDGGPPRGRLVRTARLAALPAAHAGRTAVGIGKRLGGRPAEVVAAQVQQRTAEQLFAVLGQLKGGAMKVGQAMSAMEAALPEQLAGPYREALVKLQEAAPAMPTPLVHGQLEGRSDPTGDGCSATSTTGRSRRPAWVRCTTPPGPTAPRWPSRSSTPAPARRSSPTSGCCRR
jgi:hypothetical protein